MLMDDRITTLEEKFAFLEHQVEQLDGVIREAFTTIEGLGRELAGLRNAIQQVEVRLEAEDEEDA